METRRSPSRTEHTSLARRQCWRQKLEARLLAAAAQDRRALGKYVLAIHEAQQVARRDRQVREAAEVEVEGAGLPGEELDDGLARAGTTAAVLVEVDVPGDHSGVIVIHAPLARRWSGREDLNLRPLQPHCSALAMLRHAPTAFEGGYSSVGPLPGQSMKPEL